MMIFTSNSYRLILLLIAATIQQRRREDRREDRRGVSQSSSLRLDHRGFQWCCRKPLVNSSFTLTKNWQYCIVPRRGVGLCSVVLIFRIKIPICQNVETFKSVDNTSFHETVGIPSWVDCRQSGAIYNKTNTIKRGTHIRA
jgi:hypothetical protein